MPHSRRGTPNLRPASPATAPPYCPPHSPAGAPNNAPNSATYESLTVISDAAGGLTSAVLTEMGRLVSPGGSLTVFERGTEAPKLRRVLLMGGYVKAGEGETVTATGGARVGCASAQKAGYTAGASDR